MSECPRASAAPPLLASTWPLVSMLLRLLRTRWLQGSHVYHGAAETRQSWKAGPWQIALRPLPGHEHVRTRVAADLTWDHHARHHPGSAERNQAG